MSASLALKHEHAVETSPASREEIIARYRQLRLISKEHHSRVVDSLAISAMLEQGRRIGLVEGKTFTVDSMDDLQLVMDLVIHTAPADRSRAIDRYARAAMPKPGSEEALVLNAMREARFSVYRVARRHEIAGVIVEDTMRKAELWLMDEGFEASAPDGYVMASRLYAPETFFMTAGINVPVDPGMLLELYDAVPQLFQRKRLHEVADDRRFAEAVYRIALGSGVMRKVAYQDITTEGAMRPEP